MTQPQIRQVDRRDLYPHPDNPKERSDPNNVVELSHSMAENGQLEALLVRPLQDHDERHVPGREGFEVVFGHRRRVAMSLAGIDFAMCIVRELTDDEARFAMAIERAHRSDFPPMAEARAYGVLLEIEETPEKLARRLKKSVEHVRDRLRLLDLVPDVIRKIESGALPPEYGLLLARLPANVQAEAAESFDRDGNLVGLTDAARLVRARFTLRLVDAQFDRGDPLLIQDAGPCTTCPKRTGLQAELFADTDTPDLCLDPKCHEAKTEQGWIVKAGRAETKGLRVLEGKDATKAIASGDWVDLDSPMPGDDAKNTVRQFLGAKNAKVLPHLTIARDEKKIVRELAPYEDLREASWGVNRGAELFSQHDAAREQANKGKAEHERILAKREKSRLQGIEQVVLAVPGVAAGLPPRFEHELCRLVIEVAPKDVLAQVAKRTLGAGVEKPKADLIDLSGSLTTPGESFALAVELLLAASTAGTEDPTGPGTPIPRMLAALELAKGTTPAKPTPAAASADKPAKAAPVKAVAKGVIKVAGIAAKPTKAAPKGKAAKVEAVKEPAPKLKADVIVPGERVVPGLPGGDKKGKKPGKDAPPKQAVKTAKKGAKK